MTRFVPAWTLLASVATALALSPLGCGNGPGAGARCGDEALPVACGASCERNSDCGEGLYCGTDFECIADCIAGEKDEYCDGAVCSAVGRCPGSDDFGADDDISDSEDTTDGGAGSAGCIDVEVDFSQQLPNVLLLIDRSGSMNAGGGFDDAVADAVSAGDYQLGDCPSNNDWRWNVVRDVLLNPDRGIVAPLEGKVRFGMSLYTSLDGVLDGGTCPMMESVPIAVENYDEMLGIFHCSDYTNGGDTPTGPALLEAADILAGVDLPGPKVIVLATDGEPDDCECPDFNSGNVPASCNDTRAQEIKDEVVEAAGDVAAMGIEVHVINVSSPDNAGLQTHLADVATAGGGESYP
ncbi:MAG TPA: vWA domain-containing protein, partial [Polyangiaceae bacterium]|nr:vWA domain-containing protein [Polyangiaceae bacterium]